MLYEKLFDQVKQYVNAEVFKSHLHLQGEVKAEYLAQGEYNLNYLLNNRGKRFVFRINTASQMQLENQIAYEYEALQLIHRSGVTPEPFFLDDSKEIIPYGILVMEYLPGEPLDYRWDLFHGARTFASIHGMHIKLDEAKFLIREPGPFTAMFNESSRLLDSYFQCRDADAETRQLFEKLLQRAEDKRREEDALQKEPWLAVINTEVNSHNFIVNREQNTCHLIDWEKPIYGEPAQDISMFLIATTTLWKRDYRISYEEEQIFLNKYLQYLAPCKYKNTLGDRIEMFNFFNYLRAISWCAMAWTEYIQPGRPIVNDDTFQKIRAYIHPDFIKASFPQVFSPINKR